MDSKWLLTILILVGLVLGALVGELLYDEDYNEVDAQRRIVEARQKLAAPQAAEMAPDELQKLQVLAGKRPEELHPHYTALSWFHFIGRDIFMKLLKMLIIPLIASSVVVGITSVGDFSRLGRIAIKTLIYYFATMLIAVTIGLILVNAIRPGDRIGQRQRADAAKTFKVTGKEQTVRQGPKGLGGAMLRIVEQIIPENPLEAASGGKPLPVIFFSIFFGILLTTIGAQAGVVVQFFEAVFSVMMKMVHVILWLAPLGVFCLLAWTVMRIGLAVFAQAIGVYMVTVISGLALHGVIILPLVLWMVGRTNPYRFMYQMKQALMTAFGTDSSSATLPVTIECAREYGGVSKKAAGFVLPLGSTINMDGTALYEAVAVVFLAQAWGVDLGLDQNIIIALTATLAAVGAAGIPEAGLVTMAIVVTAVNDSILGPNPAVRAIPIGAIGLIIGVDRILDMCRTTVNVWGDAVGAKIISSSEPDEVEEP